MTGQYRRHMSGIRARIPRQDRKVPGLPLSILLLYGIRTRLQMIFHRLVGYDPIIHNKDQNQ